MTKLLDEAIAQARTLPDDQQDQAADALFAHIADGGRQYRLTPDQVDEVKQIQERLRAGETTLASDKEMDALWKSCGLAR